MRPSDDTVVKRSGPAAAPPRRAYRLVTAGFGVFLIALAIVIGASASAGMLVGSILAAALLGLLGIDACASAWRARPSLIERIGPLP